jgi:hypothetical protein|tara:strand:+ start:107 stop:364 length:258 start_codon:yes stop_codon:yes gene_type:complete
MTKENVTRITVEAAGYRWQVYGDRTGRASHGWDSHLVELLGSQLLDVPVDQDLREKLRQAVAQSLGLTLAEVKPIPADVILVEPV